MNTEIYRNAVEKWPLYDSILIGSNANSLYSGQGFFDSYTALAAVRVLPFFNQRNRQSVGLAYNNFDATDKMTFAYVCESLGVEIYAPIDNLDITGGDQSFVSSVLFSGEIFKHASISLKINQDEKLVNSVQLTPAGMGPSGFLGTDNMVTPPAGTDFDILHSGFQNFSNGIASIENRFKFPVPLSIPRNQTISAEIEFSTYAKTMLTQMVGPLNVATGEEHGTEHPFPAMIRVSMLGRRAVQQRNAQHY